MAPQRYRSPISCEFIVTWQGGTKIVTQLTLKQEIILGYLVGLKVINKSVLSVEEGFRRVGVRMRR